MKIALVGYGAMGRRIESLLADTSHEVVMIACQEIGDELTAEQLKFADVAIDFSAGELMPAHIELYCQTNTPAVIGTTGWETHSDKVRCRVESAGIGIMIGSNFSAGVQTFLQIIHVVARQLNAVSGYDVYGHEVHHTNKVDSPSGTAHTITETLLEETDTKSRAEFDRVQSRIDPESLHFASIRGGTHSGLHEVTFDSEADSITLSHNAHNRTGFARGAVAAAEYVIDHAGYQRYEDLFKAGGPHEINM